MSFLFSVIIPVYNRPEEIDELLESLVHQQERNFEVLVIEDGSSVPCKEAVERYSVQLDIKYFYKENSGQGFSRNYGFERASGDYFLVFDSDCVIPPHYFSALNKYLQENPVDAFGGPDKAHENFTSIQKAISYSMTSLFTTGGIRGREQHVGAFHPRSFNMGISRDVFEKIGGYIIPRLGEDIEYSIRIIKNGFKAALIPECYVYHKRRTSFKQFWNQLHFFGRARVNIGRFFPSEVKLVHLLPLFFSFGLLFWLIMLFISPILFKIGGILLMLWAVGVFIDASLENKSIYVGFLGVVASFIQLTAYGIGFAKEKLKGKKSPFDASAGK